MLYGRFGGALKLLRRVTDIEEVRALENREPDDEDRAAMATNSYVVAELTEIDPGTERLYHLAFIRADGGANEITEALNALDRATAE